MIVLVLFNDIVGLFNDTIGVMLFNDIVSVIQCAFPLFCFRRYSCKTMLTVKTFRRFKIEKQKSWKNK